MSDLKLRIVEDSKSALRSGEKVRLATLRMVSAAIKQREIDERIVLNDTQVIVVLDKMSKQRRESITQFDKAGRDDLSDIEKAELTIIQEYLPSALTEDEINSLVEFAINEANAGSVKDMGKVMNLIKPKAQGRADMAEISARVRTLLLAE